MAEQSGRAAAQSPTTPVRVVIAEDEAIIRLDLAEMLGELGYDVVGEADSGDRALEMARNLRPDVALLDVNMPGLDGISVAGHLSADQICATVLLTAFSQRELVERAGDAGVMAYLVKPFQASDLLPAIEVAVRRFRDSVQVSAQRDKVATQLADRKLSDRAKSLLMSNYGMTEPEAFDLLQRTAMNTRSTLGAVADQVLGGTLDVHSLLSNEQTDQ